MPNQSKRELPLDPPSQEGPCKKNCKVAPPVEVCGRERLRRHKKEMAGRVFVPEEWGKEDMLKDWSTSLVLAASKDVIAARESLVAGCKHSSSCL